MPSVIAMNLIFPPSVSIRSVAVRIQLVTTEAFIALFCARLLQVALGLGRAEFGSVSVRLFGIGFALFCFLRAAEIDDLAHQRMFCFKANRRKALASGRSARDRSISATSAAS